MSGTHYTLKADVNSVRVGSIVIDSGGYTAETDAEAELLNENPHLDAKLPTAKKAKGKADADAAAEEAAVESAADPDVTDTVEETS